MRCKETFSVTERVFFLRLFAEISGEKRVLCFESRSIREKQ